MKINTRLHLTTYLTIAFSLILVTALMDTTTAVPQDSPTNSHIIVDIGQMMHGNVVAIVDSNPLTFFNSTVGGSSEIDLNLLQILPPPQA
jgi:hypothetical protein